MAPKKQKPKQPTSMISSVMRVAFFLVILGGLGAGWFAFKAMLDQKRSDGWGLSFLEWENRSYRLTQKIWSIAAVDAGRKNVPLDQKPEILWRWNGKDVEAAGGTIMAIEPGVIKTILQQDTKYNIQLLDGTYYIVAPIAFDMVEHFFPGRYQFATYLAAWPLPVNDLLPVQSKTSKVKMYLASKDGSLVASTSPAITPVTLGNRKIVQKFLNASLAKGNFEFKDKKGKPWIGFYSAVPETNLYLFVEAPRNFILITPVINQASHYILVLLGLLIALGIFMFIARLRWTEDLTALTSRLLNTAPGDHDLSQGQLLFTETVNMAKAWTVSKQHYLGIIHRLTNRPAAIAEMGADEETSTSEVSLPAKGAS